MYHVHVVEDQTLDYRALERAVARTKFAGQVNLKWFREAREALDYYDAPSSGPDLLLVDINLGDSNGFHLVSTLNSSEAMGLVPKVFCSTSDNPTDIRTGFSQGGMGYLVKPLGIDRLAEILERCFTYWFETSRRPHTDWTTY